MGRSVNQARGLSFCPSCPNGGMCLSSLLSFLISFLTSFILHEDSSPRERSPRGFGADEFYFGGLTLTLFFDEDLPLADGFFLSSFSVFKITYF